MSRRQLLVHICLDIEPAKKEFGGRGSDSRETSYWGCSEVLFPFIKQTRANFEAVTRRPLRLSWFCRADTQIEQIYGRSGWTFDTFRRELESLAAAGDEIGLHMHNWRWDDRRRGWYEEVEDAVYLEQCFLTGLEAHRAAFGGPPFAYHAGFDYMDNLLLRLLDDAGVKVAVAPMPGLRFAGRKVEGGGWAYFFDWRRAPFQPYFPSRRDYQRPGPDAASVLLVPNTIVRQSWQSRLFHLSPVRNQQRLPRRWRREEVYAYPDHTQPAEGSWRLGRMRVYRPKLAHSHYHVPPFVEPFLLRKGIETALAHGRDGESVPLTCALRSDELLNQTARKNFASNLQMLVQEAEQRDLEIRFVNSREFYHAVCREPAPPLRPAGYQLSSVS